MTFRVLVAGLLLSSASWAQSEIVGNGAEVLLSAGAQDDLAPAGLEIQSGGKLTLAGTSSAAGQQAIISSGPISGVPITVLAFGTLEARYAKFENITTLTVAANGKIIRLFDTVFTDRLGLNPGTTPWIDLSALQPADRANLPFSFNRVSFIDPQPTVTRKNIKSGLNMPLLRLLGNTTAHGNRWGAGAEDDAASVIFWHSGQVSRTPSGTFDTLEDGLKDAATTSTSVFTVNLGSTGFIDDIVDFNTLPAATPASASGPVIRSACLAPMTGKTVFDSDIDSARRGEIINCVIARGTVEESTARNCTFFNPGSAVITVNNMAGTNLLIQSGFSGSGNASFTTSLTNVVSTFFNSPTSYNFHLISPGGIAAIDEGTVQGVLTDIDGENRGVYGKVGGSGSWDIGADEFPDTIAPTIANVTSATLDGSYKAGSIINVTVNFSEPVTLAAGGNLQVTLNTGAVVNIAPFGPAWSASTSYTVAAGQNTPDLTANSPLTLTGTLRDTVNLSAVLTIPANQNLGNLKNIVIDTTAPSIVSVTSATSNGTYTVGDSVNIKVIFSESVTLTGGSLQVSLNTGVVVTIGAFGPAIEANGTYMVAAGQNTPDLNAATPLFLQASATLIDAAGNASGLVVPAGQNLADLRNIVIDTPPPAPVITTQDGKKTNKTTPVIAGTCVSGATVRVSFNGVQEAGLATVTGTSWSYTATAKPEGVYAVTAKATVGVKTSAPSTAIVLTIDLTAPAAPTALIATPKNSAIALTWTASISPDTRGYNVYRKTGTAAFAKVNPKLVVGTQYLDSTVLTTQTYVYYVTAVDDTLNETGP